LRARASSLSRIHEHTHSDTTHLLGLFWSSDQPDTETSLPDNTQHTQQTDIHAPSRIQTHNPSNRAAASPYLRLRGHWDRQFSGVLCCKYVNVKLSMCMPWSNVEQWSYSHIHHLSLH